MLILSRQRGEEIVMNVQCPDGTEIRISVIVVGMRFEDAGLAKTRLGITAPQSVKILRAELATSKPAA